MDDGAKVRELEEQCRALTGSGAVKKAKVNYDANGRPIGVLVKDWQPATQEWHEPA